jgi:hypothetical protein
VLVRRAMRIISLLSLVLLGAACVEPAADATSALSSAEDNVEILAVVGAPLALTSDGASLYWVDDVDDTLYRMPENGGALTVLARDVRVGSPWAIAVDATHVYWGDVEAGAIRRVPKIGGASVTLAAGEGQVMAVVVDGNHVFWTANGRDGGRVRRLLRTGGTPLTVTTGSYLSALAVDAFFVYVADAHVFAGANQILRAPRGGGARIALSSDEDALGLASDGSRLYWKRFWTGDVRRASKYMPGAATIAPDGGGWGDLAVDATHVWWTTGPLLHRVAKAGGRGEVVVTLPSWGNSLALDGGAVYVAVDQTYLGDDQFEPGLIVRVTP